MKWGATFVVVICSSFLSSALSEEVQQVWTSTYTKSPPSIDGQIDEVWNNTEPLSVTVREALGGGGEQQVLLRALHTDNTFYVLAQWEDATRSDMRDPYVWNPEKEDYERSKKPDDQFALQFPLEGDLVINMLTTSSSFKADVWHWKAGRSNLAGWVDDKSHVISQKPVDGAKKYDLGGHATVYISRPMDDGQASYKEKSKPVSFEGDVVRAHEPQEPNGSVADVRGKGVHDGKGWTLEMARRFHTGYSDDASIDPTKETPCAIAVLNDELDWDHSVSQLIALRFASSRSANASSDKNPKIFRFDADSTGSLLRTWKAEATEQKGPLATWQIVADATAPSRPNVLALTSPNHESGGTYNLCWNDATPFKDGEIELMFKANSGKIDQGGGPIWRVTDKDNYYICRANPLEDNFRLYFVKDGSRKQIASANVKIPTGTWHAIKIIHQDNHIVCSFNGKKLLDVIDDTFPETGGIGLWTKADAATSFDNIVVTFK